MPVLTDRADDPTTTAAEPTNGAPVKAPRKAASKPAKAPAKATAAKLADLPAIPATTVRVALSDIHDDPAIAVRFRTDAQTVENYARDMADGKPFPPVLIGRYPDGKLYLIGGGHRRGAALLNGYRDIDAKVVECDPRQAFLLAIHDNRAHGLPMSNEDKGYIVAKLVQSGMKLSDRALGEMVGLSHMTVKLLREQIESGKSVEDIEGEKHARRSAASKAKAKAKARRARGGDPDAESDDDESEADDAPQGDDSPLESDWTDKKWLAERVNPKLTAALAGDRLKRMQQEAVRWRKAKAARETFQSALNAVGVKQAVEGGSAGPWSRALYFALLLAGPNRWQVCGGCQGAGKAGGAPCPSCDGAGYHVPKAGARK